MPRPPRAPAQRHAAVDALFFFLRAAMVSFIFTQGNLGAFLWTFCVMAAAKAAVVVLSRVQLARRRPEADAAHQGDRDGQGDAPPGMAPMSRKAWAVYVAQKSFWTFFVSISPSFRVEALQEELRNDGIVYPPREGQPLADRAE